MKPIKRRLSRDEWKQLAKQFGQDNEKLVAFTKQAMADMKEIREKCASITLVESQEVLEVLKGCIEIARPYCDEEVKNESEA